MRLLQLDGRCAYRVYRTGVIIANKTAITAKQSLKLLLKREKSTPENALKFKSLLGVLLVPRLIAVVVCFTFADVCDYFKFYGFLVLIFQSCRLRIQHDCFLLIFNRVPMRLYIFILCTYVLLFCLNLQIYTRVFYKKVVQYFWTTCQVFWSNYYSYLHNNHLLF